jgi:hypothetical protein
MKLTRLHITGILAAGLVLSYAAWKGNNYALTEQQYYNAAGQRIFPVATRTIEQAAQLGSAQYYTGADGLPQTDIHATVVRFFNWADFFEVLAFGFGIGLLLSLITRMIPSTPKA